MPTQTQKLFNLFMQQHYPELIKEMPMQDIMHDAYVTVYHFRRPLVPTPEKFRQLMHDSYRRHFLYEFNHAMHYPCPDPRFWLYVDESPDFLPTEDGTHDDKSYSLNDLSSTSLRNLFAFVRKRFSQESYQIFYLAVVHQLSYSDIAKATGISRNEVRDTINEIERALQECRRVHPKSTNRKSPNRK